MPHINVEIKARCDEAAAERVRECLAERSARFIGIDHQTDTYFLAATGRLKLREGEIENALIYYERPDQGGPKQSHASLFHLEPGEPLKQMLTRAMGIDVIVAKKREIYFVENVKFHIDVVEDLGTFIEIEAIDEHGSIGIDVLHRQCNEYLDLFAISNEDLLSASYSDMLRNRPRNGR